MRVELIEDLTLCFHLSQSFIVSSVRLKVLQGALQIISYKTLNFLIKCVAMFNKGKLHSGLCCGDVCGGDRVRILEAIAALRSDWIRISLAGFCGGNKVENSFNSEHDVKIIVFSNKVWVHHHQNQKSVFHIITIKSLVRDPQHSVW